MNESIHNLDADLGERIRAWLIRDEVIDRLIHVDAIDRVVVRLLAVAIHVRTAAAEVPDRR